MMIRSKKINDIKIDPLILNPEPKNILGYELFPTLHANIFICAPKNSGKTTVIKTILDKCADKDTHIIIFCATVNNDKSWIAIKENLRKRKIYYTAYNSIYTDNGSNIIDAFIKTLQEEEGLEPYEEHDPNLPEKVEVKNDLILFGDDSNTVKRKKRKKYISPKYIIVMDDLSTELKDKAIPKLMKIHRHFDTKIIISSQSWLDTDPKIRKGNLDYVLLFKNIPEDILERIHEELSIIIPFDLFVTLYKHATDQKYHFLYIDRSGRFRKDFNKEYLM